MAEKAAVLRDGAQDKRACRTVRKSIGAVAVLVVTGIGAAIGAQAQVQTAPTKSSPVGIAPQSTHFPVLLLAVGVNPTWDVRIGPNGPERLDRPLYPPIPLEPGEVSQEAPNAWVYHAKDTQTGAVVSVLLTRDACTDGSTTKYSFRAVVQHAQLGSLNGCARIAAELFPRTNQDDEDSDEDSAKKKPTTDTTVTSFKMPVDSAYVTTTNKIVLRRGVVPHVVGSDGSQLSLSHDGKRLLYTRQDKTTGEHTIVLYETATGKDTDLLTGNVQQPFWSPDDTRVAFAKFVDGHWKLWVAPVSAPANATSTYAGDIAAIEGWADGHTILVDDLNQLSWVGEDGSVQRTLPDKDLYGDAFGVSSGNTVRVHPLNPDLLLVSAETSRPVEMLNGTHKAAGSAVFFLYEIASKRRVLLSPPDMQAAGRAEWSRDGLQIFFTATDATRRTATWHIFWDAGGLKRYVDGRDLVIGQ